MGAAQCALVAHEGVHLRQKFVVVVGLQERFRPTTSLTGDHAKTFTWVTIILPVSCRRQRKTCSFLAQIHLVSHQLDGLPLQLESLQLESDLRVTVQLAGNRRHLAVQMESELLACLLFHKASERCISSGAGKPYDWRADIWSMGVVLYELCMTRVPFDALDLKGLLQQIVGGRTPDIAPSFSQGLRTLVQDLLCRNAAKRPPCTTILKLPIVNDVVRKMLGEANHEDGNEPSQSGPEDVYRGAPSSSRDQDSPAQQPLAVQASPKVQHHVPTPAHKRGSHVEYKSETYNEWLPATVDDVDSGGRIKLNIKPNMWLSLEVQAIKIRLLHSEDLPVGKPPPSPMRPNPTPNPSLGALGSPMCPGGARRRPSSAKVRSGCRPSGEIPAHDIPHRRPCQDVHMGNHHPARLLPSPAKDLLVPCPNSSRESPVGRPSITAGKLAAGKRSQSDRPTGRKPTPSCRANGVRAAGMPTFSQGQ